MDAMSNVSVWCQECGTDLTFILDEKDGRLLISVYPCPTCEEQIENDAFAEGYSLGKSDGYEMRRQQSSRYE